MGQRWEIKKKWENDVFSILFPKMPSNFHILPHNNMTSDEKMKICLISKKNLREKYREEKCKF